MTNQQLANSLSVIAFMLMVNWFVYTISVSWVEYIWLIVLVAVFVACAVIAIMNLGKTI